MATGGGAVRPRPRLLGRRPGLRHRLPRARAGTGPARGPGAARGAGRPYLLETSRPQPPALGALPDPRARAGTRRADDQGASRGHRRALRRRDPRIAARSHARKAAPRPNPLADDGPERMPSQVEMLRSRSLRPPSVPAAPDAVAPQGIAQFRGGRHLQHAARREQGRRRGEEAEGTSSAATAP